MWMNTFEIDRLANFHKNHAILGKATKFLQAFRDLVNDNSDGWAYYQAASKSADKLMRLIAAYSKAVYTSTSDSADLSKLTEQMVNRTLTPIKAFCTKHEWECPVYDPPVIKPEDRKQDLIILAIRTSGDSPSPSVAWSCVETSQNEAEAITDQLDRLSDDNQTVTTFVIYPKQFGAIGGVLEQLKKQLDLSELSNEEQDEMSVS